MSECTGCGLIITFLLHHYFGFSLYELIWNTVPTAMLPLLMIPMTIIICQLATCSPIENWMWDRRNARRLEFS